MIKRTWEMLMPWLPATLVVLAVVVGTVFFRAELTDWFSPPRPGSTADGGHRHGPAAAADERIAYYTCSMHPSVRQTQPGQCPICNMKLTPVTHEELESGMIVVDSGRRQRIGVKTAHVLRRPMVKEIRTVGVVGYDQTTLAEVSLKVGGWIGEIDANFTGVRVEAGQPLFTLYSPELLAAQEEYLAAAAQPIRSDTGTANPVLASARRRLLLWDMTAEQLDGIRAAGEPMEFVPVLSPVSGTVIEKTVVKGSRIEPGAMLYRIADLSTVWIDAKLYEQETALVNVGDAVEVSLPHVPGETFEGVVSYVYPYLDEQTRTARIRIEAPNPEGLLKPGMYAQVALSVPLGERLAVPYDAVIFAGEKRVVFVDLGDDRLKPQPVRTGLVTGDWIEITDGLNEHDVIVVSGNYLIAAESKLKSGMDKW